MSTLLGSSDVEELHSATQPEEMERAKRPALKKKKS